MVGRGQHQETKSTAGFSYNKMTQTLLARSLYAFLDTITEPAHFQPCVMGSLISMPPWAKECVRTVLGCQTASVATSIKTPRGDVKAGDVVEVDFRPPVLGKA